MSTRKHDFVVGEYYHIYNRGVDKRDIIIDSSDLQRLLQSLEEFNTIEPIRSIYENSFRKGKTPPGDKAPKLVEIVAFCINPNHFHLLLTPLEESGIEKFMQRIGGYTKYFNNKYNRTGRLFQDKFKSKHISNNTYLLHLSAYINMNNLDSLGSKASKLSFSSLDEYLVNKKICNPSIVLEQFNNKNDYKKFVYNSWKETYKRKNQLKLSEVSFDNLEALLPS